MKKTDAMKNNNKAKGAERVEDNESPMGGIPEPVIKGSGEEKYMGKDGSYSEGSYKGGGGEAAPDQALFGKKKVGWDNSHDGKHMGPLTALGGQDIRAGGSMPKGAGRSMGKKAEYAEKEKLKVKD